MAAAGMIRVLLADDQALIRMGFRMVLDAEADIEVVGEAADGAAAITQAKALNPDVVLMDIRMPGVNGIELPPNYPHPRYQSTHPNHL